MQKSILRFALTLLALLFTCQAIAADLVVSAAGSLTNAFADIGKEFEKAKPGAKVLFNFAGSGQLLTRRAGRCLCFGGPGNHGHGREAEPDRAGDS